MTIYAFISEIPDVVWSGLIASALTLSGVLLSNWSNTNRLKLQLSHDSEERSKQRKSDLRREVYLKAAEELVKANMHLASIPQLDLTKVNAGKGMQGFFSAATKLQMIAEVRTSLLVNQLVGSYSELFLKVLSQSLPIQQLQTDIAISTERYDRVQSEINRILATMSQLNESGKPDQAAFCVLAQSFESQQCEATKLASEMENFWAQRNAAHIAFVREFIPEMKTIGQRGVCVMVEIRRELDVGGDIEAFMNQMEEQWQRMSAQLDMFLSRFEYS